MASKSSSARPFLNKSERAKLGKETINVVIPQILNSNDRAKKGVSAAQLILYDPKAFPVSNTVQAAESTTPSPALPLPKIRVIQSDTLDAASSILNPSANSSRSSTPNVAILNMCSPLRPGGGVLSGARAQEESLCLRSTLYPSLRADFYRLPEAGAVYTPDVLVFRASTFLADGDLPKAARFFVKVISCAALRFPDTTTLADGSTVYAAEASREAMTIKVRLIVQVARQMGVTHLVLGALGCGAYANPPAEVARIFKRVICGDKKRPGVRGSGIEEITFAIFDDGENLRVFREAFEDVAEGA